MQSEVCDERPDCCLVLEERDQWVMNLDDIQEADIQDNASVESSVTAMRELSIWWHYPQCRPGISLTLCIKSNCLCSSIRQMIKYL